MFRPIKLYHHKKKISTDSVEHCDAVYYCIDPNPSVQMIILGNTGYYPYNQQCRLGSPDGS